MVDVTEGKCFEVRLLFRMKSNSVLSFLQRFKKSRGRLLILMLKMSMLSADTPEFHPTVFSSRETQIKEVWETNLVDEIKKISELIEKYPIVAMDTEFPGIPFAVDDHYRDL